MQREQIGKLSSFLEKDENELRTAFDLYPMLDRNIVIQKHRIEDRLEGHPESFKYNNYIEGDGDTMIFLAKEGKYQTTPSGVSVNEGPHDALFLVTTDKYRESMKFIEGFQKSTFMPTSVIIPLGSVDEFTTDELFGIP
jgi:hypothetical protein